MDEIRIYSWQHFATAASEVPRGRFLWRGQRDPGWPLASSLERRVLALWGAQNGGPGSVYPYSGRPTPTEKETIAAWTQGLQNHFSRAIVGVPGAPRSRPNGTELWALGRHYGLITPLLDWSLNHYFAAFFALTDGGRSMTSPTHDVAIYRLDYGRHLDLTGILLHDNLWLPDLHRLHRQAGVFTQLDGSVAYEIEGACVRGNEPGSIKKYVIDKTIVESALRDLRAHGVDFNLVYPDVEGAALFANRMLFGD